MHRNKINVTVHILCCQPNRQTARTSGGNPVVGMVSPRACGGSMTGEKLKQSRAGSNSESSNRNLVARQQGQEISEWKIRNFGRATCPLRERALPGGAQERIHRMPEPLFSPVAVLLCGKPN